MPGTKGAHIPEPYWLRSRDCRNNHDSVCFCTGQSLSVTLHIETMSPHSSLISQPRCKTRRRLLNAWASWYFLGRLAARQVIKVVQQQREYRSPQARTTRLSATRTTLSSHAQTRRQPLSCACRVLVGSSHPPGRLCSKRTHSYTMARTPRTAR